MILSKEEKVIVLLYRIQMERHKTLMGEHGSYSKGEDNIRKLQRKIEQLGGNPNSTLKVI